MKVFYLGTWHSVDLLSFITKHFLLKLQNCSPDLFSYNFFFFPWHGICAPWGNSHFLLCTGKLLSWSFVARSSLLVVWSSHRVFEIFLSGGGKKKGKVTLGTLLWLLRCSDFCCGTDLVQLLWQLDDLLGVPEQMEKMDIIQFGGIPGTAAPW